MGTMCSTNFKTNDQSIVEIIKTGLITDFEYDKEAGIGFFYVKYGLANLDLDKIVDIATENKSSFRFECMGDYYFPYFQVFEFKDGVQIVCESRDIEYDVEDFTTNNYYFYYHLNKDFPADEVVKIVENHDYESFRKLQQEWGEFYLPNYFFAGDEEIEIDKNTFGMIDYAEYECG